MPPEKKEKNRGNRFARLSGVGLQMGATIFFGAWLGKFLDDKYHLEKRWWTIGLTLLAVGLALYNVLRQLNRINAEEDEE